MIGIYFEGLANLQGISNETDNLYISQALHKTAFKVRILEYPSPLLSLTNNITRKNCF